MTADEQAALDAQVAKDAADVAAVEEQKRKDEIDKLSLDEAKSRVSKEITDRQAANREAQNLRARVKELEAADKKRVEDGLSELEKANKRALDLEVENFKISQTAQNTRIEMAASKLGFHNPSDAVLLINKEDLTDDEKNLETLLKTLIKERSYLVKPSGGLPNRQTGNNPGGNVELESSKQDREKATKFFPSIGRLRQK